jgi:hypothetical protein
VTRIIQVWLLVFVVLVGVLISTLWVGPAIFNPIVEIATTGGTDVGSQWYGTFQWIEIIMTKWTPLIVGGGFLLWAFVWSVFWQGGIFR